MTEVNSTLGLLGNLSINLSSHLSTLGPATRIFQLQISIFLCSSIMQHQITLSIVSCDSLCNYICISLVFYELCRPFMTALECIYTLYPKDTSTVDVFVLTPKPQWIKIALCPLECSEPLGENVFESLPFVMSFPNERLGEKLWNYLWPHKIWKKTAPNNTAFLFCTVLTSNCTNFNFWH